MAAKNSRPAGKSAKSRDPDAIALLKSDHRQVAQWFAQFSKESARSSKRQLAHSICEALTIHTTIEEELFYPAFLQATGDTAMHHEAIVEHAGAKALIAELQDSSGDDDYFDARVTVLSEMIKHHVKEEEQPGGMFAEARKSNIDLRTLGKELLARKQELQSRSDVGMRGRAARQNEAALGELAEPLG